MLPFPNQNLEIFESLLPPTAESGGESFDLLYQNSIRKYEHELEH